MSRRKVPYVASARSTSSHRPAEVLRVACEQSRTRSAGAKRAASAIQLCTIDRGATTSDGRTGSAGLAASWP